MGRASCYVLLLVYSLRLITVSSAADKQSPCCYPKQFTVLQETVDRFLDNGTIVTVEGAKRLAYDAINKKVAEITDAYNDVTGVTVKTKVIYDFKKAKMYTIQGKECTMKPLSRAFSETCMPSIAKVDAALDTGFGIKVIPVHAYNFLLVRSAPHHNVLVQYMVGAEGCTPIQVDLIATGDVSQQMPKLPAVGQLLPTDPLYKWINSTAPGGTQKLTSAYQYSDYKEGIQPSPGYWFDPPSGCKRGASAGEKEQPIRKKLVTQSVSLGRRRRRRRRRRSQ